MTEQQGTSRRRFLGGAAAAGVGLAAGVGVAAGYGLRSANDPEQTTADPYQASTDPDARANAVVPFYAAQQAGVTTTQQERLMFAALDVTTTDVEQLQRMLGRWAAIAAQRPSMRLSSSRSAVVTSRAANISRSCWVVVMPACRGP